MLWRGVICKATAPGLILCGPETFGVRVEVLDNPTVTTFSIMKYKDLTNQRFGRLVAIRYVDSNEFGCAEWLVRCDCGTEFLTLAQNIVHGKTKSCGCLRREILTGKPSRNKK